jgi:hypothetical protein
MMADIKIDSKAIELDHQKTLDKLKQFLPQEYIDQNYHE